MREEGGWGREERQKQAQIWKSNFESQLCIAFSPKTFSKTTIRFKQEKALYEKSIYFKNLLQWIGQQPLANSHKTILLI